MFLRRTTLALLLSLTMALAPAVSMAMGRSCAATAHATGQVSGDQSATGRTADVRSFQTLDAKAPVGISADCPQGSMPNCASMPQCQTASGCSGQCLGSLGVVTADHRATLAQDHFAIGANQALASLAITPPAPPPCA